jgi:hypothetical protein
VPFSHKESNSVAAGTYNIYIFQPNQVGRVAALPDGETVTVETDFSRPGMKFTFNSCRAIWTVRPDRVIISSESRDEDCGVILSKILEWLPVTPISAIGHNFEFVGVPGDLPARAGSSLFRADRCPADYDLKQRTWHFGLEKEKVVFNLTAAARETEIVLSANVHFPTAEENKDARIRFAKTFLHYREESARLLSRLFEVEVAL